MTGGLPLLIGTLALGSKAEVRVSLDSFQGRPRVDLRTWCDFSAGPVSMRGPTKKGVSLPVADLPALLATIRDAVEQAHALGLLAKGGAEGA